MLRKSLFHSALVIITLFCLCAACSSQKTEWQGTIEKVDGVTVIQNPRTPLYNKKIFSLEEELKIGVKEGQHEYMFSRIAIDIDADGLIYVLESKEIEIRVFDGTGKYIRSFGEKGQGPGEMERPTLSGFHITPQKEIVVNDASTRRIIFYSLNGEYLRQISTASIRGAISSIRVDTRDNFYFILNFPPVSEIIEKLIKYDSHLTSGNTLKVNKGGPPQLNVIHPIIPFISFVLTRDDKVIWGLPKEYELVVLNSDGKTEKLIRHRCNPAMISETYKEKDRKYYENLGRRTGRKFKLPYPKYFPFFSDISLDDNGRLFVKTYEHDKDNDTHYYYDVFDAEGIYLAKIPIRGNGVLQYIWKQDYLYAVELDEDGYQYVKRYKVTWNY